MVMLFKSASMVLVEVVVEVQDALGRGDRNGLLVVDDVDTVVDDSEEVVVGLDEVVDKDVAVVALELDELEDVDVDVVVLKLLSLVKVAGNTIAVASSLKTTSQARIPCKTAESIAPDKNLRIVHRRANKTYLCVLLEEKMLHQELQVRLCFEFVLLETGLLLVLFGGLQLHLDKTQRRDIVDVEL
eukprot:6002091-Amphidinium_carterae.1